MRMTKIEMEYVRRDCEEWRMRAKERWKRTQIGKTARRKGTRRQWERIKD